VKGLEVVNLDSLTRLMNRRGSQVAIQLRNSIQVIGVFSARADSMVLRIDLRPPGWPVRGRVIRVESPAVPRDQPLAAVEAIASKLDAFLRRAVP
jgi:hypothetical protein